nr:hypothetical protein Hi04_10k_c554_00023 [uncultured bacterium]
MNLRTLRIVSLAVLCGGLGWLGCEKPTAPPPSFDLVPLTGNVIAQAATTGSDLPSGYTATLDLGTGQSVSANGSTTFANQLQGPHTVQLSGVAKNCTVTSANPQVVTLVGSSVTASFTVSCAATTGNLTVTTSTQGSVPTGNYSVTLDQNAATQQVAPNGNVTFSGLQAGSHTVTLSAVPANCTVTSANPQSPTVQVGQTATASFTVSCTATTGTLTVTSTTSPGTMPGSYAVTVSGTVNGSPVSRQNEIAPSGTTTFTDLSPATYTVQLSGVPSYCTVTSANPQSVTVQAGQTATVSFTVNCTGTLTVTNTTTGSAPTTNYTVTTSGTPGSASQSMAPNGSATFSNVLAGTYQVTLSAVPANCTVTNANPQSVTVRAGQTATASFTVNCGSTPGTLTVSNTTTGSVPATNYTVTASATVNGSPLSSQQPMAPNGSTTFSNVPPATYQVTLSAVPTNCTVTSANPQSVTMQGGQTATTSFTVNCGPAEGNLTVSNTTTGSVPATSYTVTASGTPGQSSQPMAPNGTATFINVPVGTYQVTLSAVPANCTVTSANPQSVTVQGGQTATAAFTVNCGPTTGALTVSNTTSGPAPTTNYTVTASGAPGSATQPMAPNGSTTFTNVSPATYTVQLSAVPANCTVTSANPQNVTVQAGQTANASFTVSCGSTTGALTVSNTTTGSAPATNYTVTASATVNGSPVSGQNQMAPNGSTTFTNVPPATYQVTLSAVPANCTVTSANPQNVTVQAGQTATASFAVNCGPAAMGTLTVSNTTTGSAPGTNYTVTASATVNGSPVSGQNQMAPNGSTTFNNVPPATYQVTLSAVPANCTVTSANPQSVPVQAGQTATTAFSVNCTATGPGTEISGTGQIGQGPAVVGSKVDGFSFDVRSDLTGTLLIKHYSEPAPDGGPETLTVNATDPATMVTSFLTTSSVCSDPSKGAEFFATARYNNGPNGSPGSLLHVRVVACDYDATAGGGTDFWGYLVQENGFQSTGYLTSGDIVKSTF